MSTQTASEVIDAGPQSNVIPHDGDSSMVVAQPTHAGRNGGLLRSGGTKGPRPLARKRQAVLAEMMRAVTPKDCHRVMAQLLADATNEGHPVKDRTMASRVLLDFLGKPTLQERAEVGAAAGVGGGAGPTVFVFESDPVAIRRV